MTDLISAQWEERSWFWLMVIESALFIVALFLALTVHPRHPGLGWIAFGISLVFFLLARDSAYKCGTWSARVREEKRAVSERSR